MATAFSPVTSPVLCRWLIFFETRFWAAGLSFFLAMQPPPGVDSEADQHNADHGVQSVYQGQHIVPWHNAPSSEGWGSARGGDEGESRPHPIWLQYRRADGILSRV